MRTIRHLLLVVGLLPLAAAGGCKWTDFDDLEEQTWATSTGKPDNAAANWAVAIARLDQAGSGGTLAVLGANQALYNDVVLDGAGKFQVGGELALNPEFAIANLAVEPLFLTRPDADEVALVTGLDANRVIAVRTSVGAPPATVTVTMMGTAQTTGATYMVSPARPTLDPGPQTQILIANVDTVYGAYFDAMKAPNPQTSCRLRDEAMAGISIRALGAYRPMGAMYDDVIALTDAGKLLVYDGAVFHGCATPAAPRTGQVRDLTFPGVQFGSQLLAIPGMPYVLVQAHNDSGKGRLGLYKINAGSIDEVGTSRELDRLRTAALFSPAGQSKQFVLAGQPGAVVEGVSAGQVQVLEVDLTTGVAASPAMTLFDAQPEDNQAFGRGVAELPFNDKKIIAVAADNDVILYFRTSLYDETRQGR